MTDHLQVDGIGIQGHWVLPLQAPPKVGRLGQFRVKSPLKLRQKDNPSQRWFGGRKGILLTHPPPRCARTGQAIFPWVRAGGKRTQICSEYLSCLRAKALKILPGPPLPAQVGFCWPGARVAPMLLLRVRSPGSRIYSPALPRSTCLELLLRSRAGVTTLGTLSRAGGPYGTRF